ncbi:hypothetical protein SAMN05444008_106275 [Cnuella takakiae]|uniref:Bacterial alpha-2-macroglobulin MG10 domain-containing protein n=1 Tax=Cnuella takakiae TaxID=1302690 RepID=A0A1M5AII5_9BACT|nr:hypothetical protein [Cnuella takakiae]OLY91951.1 hypothetical protein BUE76_08630 [Cnuella takakiae]SHF29936.1 hypothetical protein SAMN05444008_106275 [Cnuella takakiae]
MRTLLFCILIFIASSAQAQKSLLLQPAIPAILRNGDRMEFQLTIQNSGSKDQTGQAELQLTDAETGVSIDGWFQNVFPNQYFTAEAKQAAVASFPIEVPYQFFKKAAWRFIVRTPTDSLITSGSFPVLPVLQPFSKTALFSGAGNFTFPALLESGTTDTRQNAALHIEAAASPKVFAYAALAKQLEANSITAIDLGRQLFAAHMLKQLATNNPTAYGEIAHLSTKALDTTTSRLFARLLSLQQTSGGFSLLPGGNLDALTSWQVGLNLARLRQLKATTSREEQNAFKKVISYLQRTQHELPTVVMAYLETMAGLPVSASKNQQWISASLSTQPHWVQAMTAVLLQRMGKKEAGAQVYQLAKSKQLQNEASDPSLVSTQSLMLEYALLANDTANMKSISIQVLEQLSGETNHSTANAYALLLEKASSMAITNANIQLGKLPLFAATSHFFYDTSIAGGLVQPALGKIQIGQQGQGPLLTRVVWHYVDESSDVQPEGIILTRTWSGVKDGNTQPLTEGLRVAQGSQLELTIEINTTKSLKDLHLSTGVPAGFKPLTRQMQAEPGFVNLHLPLLQPGKHRFTCRIQAEQKGSFASGPVVLRSVGNEQPLARMNGEVVVVE